MMQNNFERLVLRALWIILRWIIYEASALHGGDKRVAIQVTIDIESELGSKYFGDKE